MSRLSNDNKYLTQKELAKRWHLSQSCVKNYRVAGYLPYFQLPGSTRILYPVAEIERIEKENTKPVRKGVKQRHNHNIVKRKSPEISSTKKKTKWRI